jgi:hypothetical protein
MSPIKNLSDVVRMPRLGKIRLGIKVEEPNKSPYPKATDYFVCPKKVQEVYGEEPKELDIMFPVEDPAQFAQQWLRRYSRTQGLTCIGDAQTCRQKTDTKTGAMVNRDSRDWVWKEGLTCNPQDCPEYTKKFCRRIMNLQFLLPEVEGLGVWQVDSTSFYSIVNINSMVEMLKGMIGRCSMIPLKLVLGPVEVTPPGGTKKTVFVMHISTDVKIAELAKLAQLPTSRALVIVPEPETEQAPADLYPEGMPEEPEEDIDPFPDESPPAVDREALRKEITQLLSQGPRPTDRQINAWWFEKPWGYTLTAQDLAGSSTLSGDVKVEHLEVFKKNLEAFKARAAQKK